MKRQFSLILIITFVFILAWLVFNIYHSAVNSTISENTNIQIQPIAPSFDVAVIQTLQKREMITPIMTLDTSLQTGNSTGAATKIIIPTPTPTLAATQSAQTQSATTSAIPTTGQ